MAIIVRRRPVERWWVVRPAIPWVTDAFLSGNGWPWGWGALYAHKGVFRCSMCNNRFSGGGLFFATDDVRCRECAEEECKETFTRCQIKLAPWKNLPES